MNVGELLKSLRMFPDTFNVYCAEEGSQNVIKPVEVVVDLYDSAAMRLINDERSEATGVEDCVVIYGVAQVGLK